ncbi:MAG: 4'-phosphopantetheinyl transferase superfamily protein [Pseudomonadota bacterium]
MLTVASGMFGAAVARHTQGSDKMPQGQFSLRDLESKNSLFLPKKTVQVWVLDDALIEPACAALAHTLSLEEQQRARSYQRERHRQRFIARHGVLRWLIGRYLSRAAETLCFSLLPVGKPFLQQADATGFAFSVSQTEGMALFAFAWDCRLGVDVEHLIDGVNVARVGRLVFSSVEVQALEAECLDATATFFHIWTRKEALLKALGIGLTGSPKLYATLSDPRFIQGHWHASNCGAAMPGWTCCDLALAPVFPAALAVSLDNAQVSIFHCA